MSSTTNGRFIKLGSNIYDYFNGQVSSTSVANNYQISGANSSGEFTYSVRLGDLIGSIFDCEKDIIFNEWIYVNLYLNNSCVCVVTSATGVVVNATKNFTTSQVFLKIPYQQNASINAAIKANIMSDQGLVIPFPYINNFSFNDPPSASAHTVALSLRIYNMIGNKLRRIYLIPSSLSATVQDLQAGKSLLNSASTVQFSIDSNLITQYDNTKYENLLNCKLWNKYWGPVLQSNNFFLPIYFYNCDKDNDNINEGMPINTDTLISFNCNNTGTSESASYDVFAEGVKNLIINRNGVTVV